LTGWTEKLDRLAPIIKSEWVLKIKVNEKEKSTYEARIVCREDPGENVFIDYERRMRRCPDC